MAFSKETLEKSRRLMSPDMNKKMDGFKGQGITSSYFDTPDYNYINEMEMRNQNPNVINENRSSRSINSLNIPDCVKQSFMEQEINVDCLNPNYQQSRAFDDIVESISKERNVQTNQECHAPQMISESTYSQQYPSSSGIDYNIIAKIIEECIDRKLNTLNENTLKAVKLKDGKISLQDHQGNVYSAALEFKGNLNEQKSKKKVL